MNLIDKAKNVATDVTGKAGTIQNWFIAIESAEGIKDEDRFSKSDAYLKIEFGGQSQQTRTIKNDRAPSWNETFCFKLHDGHVRDIHLKLCDRDIGGLDDSIGSATITKAELPTSLGEEKYFKVSMVDKNQVKAMIHLRIKQTMGDLSSTLSSSTTSDQSCKVDSNFNVSQTQPMNQPIHPHPLLNQPNYGQKF